MTERDYYSMFKGAPDVLTVVEAAKLLRLGKNKTYDLIKSGYLHSIKAGGKIIVPKVCLIEFLCNENNYQKKNKFLKIYAILKFKWYNVIKLMTIPQKINSKGSVL